MNGIEINELGVVLAKTLVFEGTFGSLFSALMTFIVSGIDMRQWFNLNSSAETL